MKKDKKQKYINTILVVGLIFLLYPFLIIYTYDAVWDTSSFISLLFTMGGLNLYGRYIIVGVMLIIFGYILDKKNI